MANDERPTSTGSTDEDWFTELRPQRDPATPSANTFSATPDSSSAANNSPAPANNSSAAPDGSVATPGSTSAYPPDPWLDGAGPLDTSRTPAPSDLAATGSTDLHPIGPGGPNTAASGPGELPADDPFNSAPPMRNPEPTADPSASRSSPGSAPSTGSARVTPFDAAGEPQPNFDPPTVTTSLPYAPAPGEQRDPGQPQRPYPAAAGPGADQPYGQPQYAAPQPPQQQAPQPSENQQYAPQQDQSFDGHAAYRPAPSERAPAASPQQPPSVPSRQAPAASPQQRYTQQPYPQAPSYDQHNAPQSQPMPLPTQAPQQAPRRPLPTSSDLTPDSLVKPDAEVPQGGWRRAIFKVSGGSINPGRSKEETEREDLISRIRTPIRGCRRIAVVSLKGGIGKTTTTSCLGLTLAHYRGDRVVALDANPDAGTLAERLTGVTDVSVRDLLDNIEHVDTFTEISRYMSLAQRLQVLASDQDPEVSEAFDAEQYRQVTSLLSRYYNVILTDSGTGMLHSAMQGTLEAADALVVVGAPSVDGSSRASKTLDWLIAHGYEDLVRNSVAVISSVRERTNDVDMSILRNHFNARCRAVVEIPFDSHLVIGGPIDLGKIKPPTSKAYLELAATVADGFHV